MPRSELPKNFNIHDGVKPQLFRADPVRYILSFSGQAANMKETKLAVMNRKEINQFNTNDFKQKHSAGSN